MIIPAMIGAGAGLIGGMMTNEANKDIATASTAASIAEAARNRKFQAQQATLNRQFESTQASRARNYQLEVSKTAYQRAVGDMKKAGLNPMLAYSQGGAASGSVASGHAPGTPSGSQGQVYSPQYRDPIGGALSSATALYDVAARAAQVKNIEADTELKGRQADERGSAHMLNVWEQNKIISYLNDKLPYEIGNLVTDIVKKNADVDRIRKEIDILVEKRILTNAQAAEAWMGLRHAYNKYVAEGSDFKRNVSPYLDDVGKITSSAGDIVRSITGWRFAGAAEKGAAAASKPKPNRYGTYERKNLKKGYKESWSETYE